MPVDSSFPSQSGPLVASGVEGVKRLTFERLIVSLRRFGLGTYLALAFSLMSVLLTLILTMMINATVTEQTKLRIGNEIADDARQISLQLDQSMFERYREVQLLAARVAPVRGGDVAAWQRDYRQTLNDLQQSYPYYAWIGVTDEKGAVLAATQNILQGEDVSKRPWFKNAQRGTYVGDVHEAKLLSTLLPNNSAEPLRFVDIAFPFKTADGQVQGVMGAHLYWQWAADIQKSVIGGVANDRTVDALIVSADNTVLLGPRDIQGQTLTLASVRDTPAGRSAYRIETWPDGIDYLVSVTQSTGYKAFPGLGWKVVVRQKLGDAYAPVAQLRQRLLTIGVFVAIMFLIIGLGVARLITRPIEALSLAAREIRAGRLSEIPNEATDYREVRTLRGSLNELIRNVVRSEARLRGILGSATDAIITIDDRQNVVLFNSAAAKLFQCSEAQAIGQSLLTFIPKRFHTQHHGYMAAYRESGKAFGQAVGLKLSGAEFPAEISYSNVVQPDGVIHTLIIRDITTRLMTLEALKRSNHDLEQFAFVASHDLKTPLRSISGFIQMLEKRYTADLKPGALELIMRSRDATRRLEQLTDDLLSYARVNADSAHMGPVDLQAVAAEVVQSLDAVIRETQATVTISELPTVFGLRRQLAQLMQNLICNSLTYVRDQAPVVNLSAQRQDAKWVISVEDNGIGIEPQHYERIFEVFKRLHGQSEYAGTGIGLAVCRRVVHQHGGKIWVKSVPGKGSTFQFTISAVHQEGARP